MSTEYAIVKNNKVINVIVAEETFAEIYAAELKATAVLNDPTKPKAFIGGDIKDGKFRPIEPVVNYATNGKVTWNNENWVWVMPEPLEN
jgi:hypothetical protein